MLYYYSGTKILLTAVLWKLCFAFSFINKVFTQMLFRGSGLISMRGWKKTDEQTSRAMNQQEQIAILVGNLGWYLICFTVSDVGVMGVFRCFYHRASTPRCFKNNQLKKFTYI